MPNWLSKIILNGLQMEIKDTTARNAIQNLSVNGKNEFPNFHASQIVKHRPNTLNDLYTAHKKGYNFVEVDVRYTSDNVPVLNHDATINGLVIAETTYADLVAGGANITTLRSYTNVANMLNVMLYLDIKTYTELILWNIYTIISECDMLDSTIFGSLRIDGITILSTYNPSLIYDWRVTQRTRTQMEELNWIAENAPAHGLLVIIFGRDSSTLTNDDLEVVRAAHRMGMVCLEYTSNSKANIMYNMENGCDLVISDNITNESVGIDVNILKPIRAMSGDFLGFNGVNWIAMQIGGDGNMISKLKEVTVNETEVRSVNVEFDNSIRGYDFYVVTVDGSANQIDWCYWTVNGNAMVDEPKQYSGDRVRLAYSVVFAKTYREDSDVYYYCGFSTLGQSLGVCGSVDSPLEYVNFQLYKNNNYFYPGTKFTIYGGNLYTGH